MTLTRAKIEAVSDVEQILEDVVRRLDPTFGKSIDCENGWNDLICKMHGEIVEIDPDYGIYQIKEKFGTLRVYFKASGPDKAEKILSIVRRYERASALTCEKTGKPGQLMEKSGQYKTLHDSFQEQGWAPVQETTWLVASE